MQGIAIREIRLTMKLSVVRETEPAMDSVPQGVVSGRSQPGAKALPPDCVLLPLDRAALLVSREHAVFCRIPPEEVAAVRAAIAGSEATYSSRTW